MTAVTVGAGAVRHITAGRPQVRQGAQRAGSPTVRQVGPRVRRDVAGPGAQRVRQGTTRAGVRQLPANQAVETEFRLTRRGRRALAAAGVGVLLALTGWGSGALADQPVEPIQTTTYTFLPGESLWQVAAANTLPGQDVREVLDQIMELNGMTTSAVQAGDMIRVPIND